MGLGWFKGSVPNLLQPPFDRGNLALGLCHMSSGRFKCIEQGKTVLEGGFEWTDDIARYEHDTNV